MSSKQQQPQLDHRSFRPAGEMYVWLCAVGLTAGLLMVLGLLWVSRRDAGRPLRIVGVQPQVRRHIVWLCAAYLLDTKAPT